jgi:hypothetical protein
MVHTAYQLMADQYIRTGPIKLNPLHDSQHAHQRAKSCEMALHDLVSMVETAIDRKTHAFGAFLDIEGPSTTPRFESFIWAVMKSVQRTPTKWIDAMLPHRIVSVEIRGIHSNRSRPKRMPSS